MSSYAPALRLAGTVIGTAAQVSAAFAPVPWISPAVQVLAGMIQLYQNMQTNRRIVGHLLARCQALLEALASNNHNLPPGNLTEAVKSCKLTLESIRNRMSEWANLGPIKAFVRQDDIRDEVRKANDAISDCCSSLQISAQLGFYDWLQDFERKSAEDHEEILSLLKTIQGQNDYQTEVLMENNKGITAILGVMQQLLGQYDIGDRRHTDIQKNLYGIQTESRQLLPNFELRAGEVRRLGSYPVGGSAAFDIWEGEYLGREKCAIKVIRSIDVSPDAMRRFRREVTIWRAVWETDKGEYILPFYGFCSNDGPYPYVVSPWMRNGDSLAYIKKYPHVDRRKLVRRVAEGLNILHTHRPPIAHGDIKAANILINDFGNPLLADFGLSRILEDITGVPFTQSRGVSESFRWFAPELSYSPNIISTKSDVFAFAMTVLELMTGEQPFAEVRRTTEVLIKLQRGERPKHPPGAEIRARGLDDTLWNILLLCWSTNPDDRPTMTQVIQALPAGFTL